MHFAAVFSLLFATSAAVPAQISPESPVTAAPTGSPIAPGGETPYERLVLSFDALGLLSDRYGVSVEAVVSARDTLVIYPWYLSGESTGTPDLFAGLYDSDFTTYDTQARAFGLDAQYRHYSGHWRGARGFFLAPGFQAAHFVTESTACASTFSGDDTGPMAKCTGPERQAWSYVGPSVDFGGQVILPKALTFGASVGAQYRFVLGSLDESRLPLSWDVSHGSGLRPRVRLWAGLAF